MNEHDLDLALHDLGELHVRQVAPPDLRQGVRTVSVETPRRWFSLPRFDSEGFTMYSAFKFMAAGVIVALFGGFLLAGVFTTPQGDEVLPAAVTVSPSPTTTEKTQLRITYKPTDDPAVFKVISEPHREWLKPGGPIAIDPDGGVWVQGSDGKRAFLIELGVPGRTELGWHGRELEFSGDGTLWASTEGSLMSLEGDTWRRHDPAGVIDLTLAPGGALYGLIEYPPMRWSPDGVEAAAWFSIVDGEVTDGERSWAPLHPGKAQAVAVTPDGSVWVGGRGRGSGPFADTGSGWLLRHDGQTTETVTPLGDAIDPSVVDIAVGPAGSLWVFMRTGTGSYLGRYDGEAWSIQSTADGLPAVGVLPMGLSGERMAVGPDGRVWFIKLGAEGANEGLVAFDGQGFQRYLVDTGVSDLVVAPDGSAWASTDTGIYVIRPEAVAATE